MGNDPEPCETELDAKVLKLSADNGRQRAASLQRCLATEDCPRTIFKKLRLLVLSNCTAVESEKLTGLSVTGNEIGRMAPGTLDLSRFRSGQVLMLGGLPFESHGAFPAQG